MFEFAKLSLDVEHRLTERELKFSRRLNEFNCSHSYEPVEMPVCLDVCETKKIFSICGPSAIRFFNYKTKKVYADFRKVEKLSSFAFQPDGKLAVAGNLNGLGYLFSLDHKKIIKEFRVSKKGLRAVGFEGKGPTVSFADGGGRVSVWDFAAGLEVCSASDVHTDTVRRLRYAEGCLLSASLDKTICAIDLNSGKVCQKFSLPHEVEDLDVMDCRTQFACIGSRSLDIWDIRAPGKSLFSAVVSAKSLTGLKVMKDKIAVTSYDNSLRVFDYKSAEQHLELAGLRKFDSPVALFACDSKLKNFALTSVDRVSLVYTSTGDETDQLQDKEPLTVEQQLLAKLQKGVLTRDTTSRKFFQRGLWQEKKDGFTVKIAKPQMPNFASYEKYLRKFQFTEALLDALKTKNSVVILAVVENLVSRSSLKPAIKGLDLEGVQMLLEFISKKLDSENCQREILGLAEATFDSQNDNLADKEVKKNIKALAKVVEVALQTAITSGEIAGVLEDLTSQAF